MSDKIVLTKLKEYDYKTTVVYPYYDASSSTYDKMTNGMSDAGKKSLANMLAHHLMPIQRYAEGWLLTRVDMIDRFTKGELPSPYAFCHNDGTAHWKAEVSLP